MKNLVCCLSLLVILVGCGKNGAVNLAELNAIPNIAAQLVPTGTQTAQGVDLSTLSSLLNNAASNPALTSAQSSALSDPSNQAALQSFLQLVQGGSASTQRAAASTLISSAGGSTNVAGKLTGIFQIIQEVAPLIASFDPQIAPYVSIAEAFLPLIEALFGSSSSSTVAAAGH
jgi:hypothetical protein